MQGNGRRKLTYCLAIVSSSRVTITCPKQTKSSALIEISTLRVCINERAGYAWMLARHSDWYITANKVKEGTWVSWTYKQDSMITYALDWASRNRRWRHRCPWFQWYQRTRNKVMSKLNQSPGCSQNTRYATTITHTFRRVCSSRIHINVAILAFPGHYAQLRWWLSPLDLLQCRNMSKWVLLPK